MTFQEAAIKSAEIYYQYLSENNAGMIEHQVTRIDAEADCFFLTLSRKLKFPEAMQVKIYNELYSTEQIKFIEYDDARRIIKVRPNNALYDYMAQTLARDVIVVSDLRFLIKRVKDWYGKYGNLLCLPQNAPLVQYRNIENLHQIPTEDQKQAIEGALSTPFSYIWGAPGTGKTRFVLARCILHYISIGKKVLITAPTNNAVEQMLYGVLSVLEEAHAPLDKVLRLGIPSHEFAKKYGKVCENTVATRKLAEVNNQLSILEKRFLENEASIRMLLDHKKVLEKETSLIRCRNEISRIFDGIRELYQKEKGIEDELVVLEARELLASGSIERQRKEENLLCRQIKDLTQQIKKYDAGILRVFAKKAYENYTADLQKSIEKLDSVMQEMESLQCSVEAYSVQKESLKRQSAVTCGAIQEYKNQLEQLSDFDQSLRNIAMQISRSSYEKEFEAMTDILEKIQQPICARKNEYSASQSIPEEELYKRRMRLHEEKAALVELRKKIEADGTDERIRDCQVLAATVDTCLSRVLPDGDFIPTHVFLDEAGYCSLIKGVTLLAYHCQVTFLGDHMQLPPVCEMSDSSFMEECSEPVTLWAQSALYSEDVFSEDPKDLFTDYMEHRPARFRQLEKYDLVHTHRFGKSLARVLAKHIYSEGFHGSEKHDTEIYYINARREEGAAPRTSLAECQSIFRYIEGCTETDIGIITPYRKQLGYLKQRLDNFPEFEDAVMTVHGSQGREWDTVLFSVTDTTNMFFTDSLSPHTKGREVINTAVSRAKKKLIIVCDAGYWMEQNRQLIGALLSVAKEIKL